MSKWPVVQLGQVIRQRKSFLLIDDFTEYKRCRVQLHAQGIVLRDRVPGTENKTKKQQVCKAGDFLVAEIDAKVGGFGIVPDDLDGAIVSSHYFLFEISDDQLDRQFLEYFVRTPDFRDQVTAQGSTNYAAIRPNDVLGYYIPLPPLPEQQRIVARIEELAAKINEARGLRQRAVEETEVLVSRANSALINDAGWPNERLGHLLRESPRNGLSPKREVENGGRPMLRINAVSSSPTRFVDLTALKMVEVQDDEADPFELKCDDVFIVRYNGDINRVAKAAIYKGREPSRSIFPDKLMRLRPDHSKITPDFLVYALGSRSVRQQIEQFGKTTAGNIGISGSNAKSFQVPVPPIRDQHRIVAELDDMQFKVDALKNLQTRPPPKSSYCCLRFSTKRLRVSCNSWPILAFS